MTEKNYRQGDVLILSTNTDVQDWEPVSEDLVLVKGTETGHSHRISLSSNPNLRESLEFSHRDSDAFYIKVINPVVLTHEEHAPIEIGVGLYRIRVQRQWDYTRSLAIRVED